MVNGDVLTSSYFPNTLFADRSGRIHNRSPNPGGMLFGFVYVKVFIGGIFCFEGFGSKEVGIVTNPPLLFG